MGTEWVRRHCLALPHTTEHIQWESHLVFKIGGKSYLITSFEIQPGGNFLSLKAGDARFDELIELPGVIPAPYLARARWVAIEKEDSLPRPEVLQLIDAAYREVLSNLPKRVQVSLGAPASPARTAPARKAGAKSSRSKKPAVKAARKRR